MPVRSIKIMNVLAFQDQFTLTFSDGINVIIGGNGTGKTTLLKMIYTAAQWSAKPVRPGKNKSFHQYFSHALSDASLTNHDKNTRTHSAFAVSDGKHTLTYCLAPQERVDAQDWINLNISSVFIPTTEMLSHAKGFLALNEKYDMPFDDTQIDILINASLLETRVCPPYYAPHLFERICKQYLIRQNCSGKLAIPFEKIGKYYYDDPITRANGEFDIVTQDPEGYIFYEAKFHKASLTSSMIEQEIKKVKAAKLDCYRYGFFSRSGFESKPNDDMIFITLDDLYS